MKRIISALLCAVMLASLTLVFASANNGNAVYTFNIDGTEYTVSFENSALTPEQQQIIAERLVGISEAPAQTYGLGCTLFGHDYITETATVRVHEVYSTSPRCENRTYEIKTCEDCDYYKQTLLYVERIYCC